MHSAAVCLRDLLELPLHLSHHVVAEIVEYPRSFAEYCGVHADPVLDLLQAEIDDDGLTQEQVAVAGDNPDLAQRGVWGGPHDLRRRALHVVRVMARGMRPRSY